MKKVQILRATQNIWYQKTTYLINASKFKTKKYFHSFLAFVLQKPLEQMQIWQVLPL